MSERVLSIADGLSQLSVRLDRAAAITAGAHVCAERGAGQEAFQVILELDLDVLLREAADAALDDLHATAGKRASRLLARGPYFGTTRQPRIRGSWQWQH